MPFIVHVDSMTKANSYKTVGAAKGAMTRAKKRDGSQKYPVSEYSVMTAAQFLEADTLVETTNLMSGKKILIYKSLKGTAVDPGMERYWAM